MFVSALDWGEGEAKGIEGGDAGGSGYETQVGSPLSGTGKAYHGRQMEHKRVEEHLHGNFNTELELGCGWVRKARISSMDLFFLLQHES